MKLIRDKLHKIIMNWQKWIVTTVLIVIMLVYWVVDYGLAKASWILLCFVMIGIISSSMIGIVDIIFRNNRVSWWHIFSVVSGGLCLGYLYFNFQFKYFVSLSVLCLFSSIVFFVVTLPRK